MIGKNAAKGIRRDELSWTLAGIVLLGGLTCARAAEAETLLRDKTLVAWVALDTLEQAGGSALTIETADGVFDGIVYGEVLAHRWMPGSNHYLRTDKNQNAWAAETAGPGDCVQVAIVYRGPDITMYRNGEPYAQYTAANPPATFGPHLTVLFGKRHLDAMDRERTLTGRIRDARIYDRPLDRAAIQALRPGQSGELKPWAWWSFADEGLREKTGRFTHIKLMGDVRIDQGSLVLTGKGATVICSVDVAGGQAPSTGPVPAEVIRSARWLRERLLADPYRPGYHFCTPEDMGVPGDPNGAFYHDGRYHLMYLYNRSGSGFCWGHLSSADLVHWRHHPDAIGPGDGDEGCFSGGAFVDDDGTAYLSYWMLGEGKGIGLAKCGEPPFNHWTKFNANPVIRSTEWGITETKDAAGKTIFYGSADPSNIWKKDGRYYMLTGNLTLLNKLGRKPDSPVDEQGDRLYLFTSPDLQSCKYMHVFYQRSDEWTERSEDNMCPSLLPLPTSPNGGPASNKHLLLFISHNKGCQYYIGEYRDDRFIPEKHGRMTWVDNTYFAPEALIDGQGRQIMWAWLLDNPPDENHTGWSGVFGLPRSLWLGEDGTLRMAPVEELAMLRTHERTWDSRLLDDGQTARLESVQGDSCELQMQIAPARTGRCGVKVRVSGDGKEETLLYYDADKKQLVFDSSRSGVTGRMCVESAPLELKPSEPLTLRVFIDKSVVEVYANDRQAICRRVYPGQKDSLGIHLFSVGGQAAFKKVKAWNMAPSNPY